MRRCEQDNHMPLCIKPATERDVPVILRMIRGLAEYEKLLAACSATEEQLRESLFGPRPAAEVIIALARSPWTTGRFTGSPVNRCEGLRGDRRDCRLRNRDCGLIA